MRLILTRPLEESTKLAAQLGELGFDPVLSPAIEIRNQPGVTVDLTGAQGILATSANGIRALAEAVAARDLPVYAVGPSTAAAAAALGFTTVHVAGGDVDALAALVVALADPGAGRLVHAAGTALAGDLKGALEARGFTVERVVLYEARPAERLSPEALEAIKSGTFDGVLFFSPRTVTNFVNLACDSGLADRFHHATAYCLSQTVAAGLGPLEFARVVVAAEPTEAALVAALMPEAVEAQEAPPAPDDKPEAPPAPDDESESPSAPDDKPDGAPAAPPPVAAPTPEVEFANAPRLDPPFEAMPPRRSRRGIGWAAVILAVIGLAGAGGWLWQSRQAVLPGEPTAATLPTPDPALGERVAAVEQAQIGLGRRLAALETLVADAGDRTPGPAEPEDAADPGALQMRLDSLEQAVAGLARPSGAPSDGTALPEDVANRLAALERAAAARLPALAPGPAIDPAAFAALQASVAALRGEDGTRAKVLAEETEKLRGVGRGVSLVYALGRLRSTLDRGGPYAPSFALVRGHFVALGLADDPAIARALASLAAHAEAGVRSPAQLAADFAPVARAVVKAAAIPAEAGLADRLLAEAGNLVTIRRVGEVPGDDAEARVARAEAKLAANNLEAAAAELEDLTGGALAAAGPWLGEAKARLGALAAADMLDGEVAARFAETE